MANNLGKSGKKSGVKLRLWLFFGDSTIGLNQKDIEGMFSDVGKGLDVDLRVQIEWTS